MPRKYLFAFLFLSIPLKAQLQHTISYEDTVKVVCQYGAVFEFLNTGPLEAIANFFVKPVVKLLGYTPSKFIYEEVRARKDGEWQEVSMKLTADNGRIWFDIREDSSTESFVDLPLMETIRLEPKAISFISSLKFFLGDPKSETMTTKFIFGKQSLLAHSYRSTNSNGLLDSFVQYKPQQFIVITSDLKRRPYINGEVISGRVGDLVIYPFISAYLVRKNLKITLSIKNTEIVKK